MIKDLRDIKVRIIHFDKIASDKTALISRFNCHIRVLDGQNKEHFFRELRHALKFLNDLNFHMIINI